MSGQVLTISGERIERLRLLSGERLLSDKPETLQRTFSRQYALPVDIKANTIRASLKTGVLEVTVCPSFPLHLIKVWKNSNRFIIIIQGKRSTWKETEIDSSTTEEKGKGRNGGKSKEPSAKEKLFVRFGDPPPK
jgi:hypothetical protein